MAQENDQATGGLVSPTGEQNQEDAGQYRRYQSWSERQASQRFSNQVRYLGAQGFVTGGTGLPTNGLIFSSESFAGSMPLGGGFPAGSGYIRMGGLKNALEHAGEKGFLISTSSDDFVTSFAEAASAVVEESKAKLQEAEEILEAVMNARKDRSTHTFLEKLIAEQTRENKMTPAQQYLAFKAAQRESSK